MNSKLDYLAQKEEELRRLNEALDAQKTDLLKPTAPVEETYGEDDFDETLDKDAAFKGVPLGEGDYPSDDEEESKVQPNPQPALDSVDDSNADTRMVQQMMQLQENNDEQARTINFQKAKIAALQSELEEALGKIGDKTGDEPAAAKKTAEAAERKLQDKINNQTLQITKLKTQISEQTQKIMGLEAQIKQTAREIESGDLEIRKNM